MTFAKQTQRVYATATMSRLMFIARLALGCMALAAPGLEAEPAERVFATITSSVVEIATLDSWGSGLLVDGEGLILTNRHVAGSLPVHFVRASGRREPEGVPETRNFHAVRVVGIHKDRDLVLLKIDVPEWTFDGVSMETPVTVRPGMPCYAIGTPTGSRRGTATTHSITKGIISAVDVKLPGGPFLQTTTPVNPGNSGGPLCDAEGKVLGVVTARLEGADSIAFAIPWDVIRRADFKEPEPVAGPTFEELEQRALDAARLAAAETGRKRAARLREELDARRAQLAFAKPPPGLLDRVTELWIELGDTAAAARMVDLAHAADPDRALTGFWRGHVSWAKGRRAAALEIWLETIGRHDPPDETSRAGVARCLVGCGVVLREESRLPASWEAFRWAAAIDPAVCGINGWPADFDKLAAEAAAEVAADEPLVAEVARFSLDRLRGLMRRTPSTERDDRFAGALDEDAPAADRPSEDQPRKIPIGLPAGATNILLQNPPVGISLDPDGRHLQVLPAHAQNRRVLILFEIDGETRYHTLRIPAS